MGHRPFPVVVTAAMNPLIPPAVRARIFLPTGVAIVPMPCHSEGMTKHLNPTQKRLAKQMFQSAEQRNSLRKLARMAETLPSMEYEVERLYRDADEMDRDVDHTAGLLIDSGLTVTEISNLDDPR